LQRIVYSDHHIRSIDKSSGLPDGILDETSDQFFAPLLQENSITSDLYMHYDINEDCWFVTALSFKEGFFEGILLAVSDRGTITEETQWSFFAFQQPSHLNSLATGEVY
jgi:hypothetical protein